ncbi:MAG: hypothetical protein K1X72_00375 [Pyrinomonadaceae bacterium]|nr:hypothetical protein [Pyrinomonadaceae bacterium]
MSEELLKHQVNFGIPLGTVHNIELPNKCPHCKRLTPFHYQQINYNIFTKKIESTVKCGYGNCGGLILCYYFFFKGEGKLSYMEPPLFEELELPEFANEISSNFVSIFKESNEAKSRGLNQIAGPGFRKSCEFLIKDYAKSLITETDPTEKTKKEEEIEKKQVGNVVKDYISDSRVQKVAKRAFWLGNDETHYLRKWTDKDIDDLVTLIKLTLDWIEIERLSAKYEDEMPE